MKVIGKELGKIRINKKMMSIVRNMRSVIFLKLKDHGMAAYILQVKQGSRSHLIKMNMWNLIQSLRRQILTLLKELSGWEILCGILSGNGYLQKPQNICIGACLCGAYRDW